MSIDDIAITSTHILHLSRSKLIQQNTRGDVTLTALGVLWCDQKVPLGAVSAGYGGATCEGTTSNYSMNSQGMRLTQTR